MRFNSRQTDKARRDVMKFVFSVHAPSINEKVTQDQHTQQQQYKSLNPPSTSSSEQLHPSPESLPQLHFDMVYVLTYHPHKPQVPMPMSTHMLVQIEKLSHPHQEQL